MVMMVWDETRIVCCVLKGRFSATEFKMAPSRIGRLSRAVASQLRSHTVVTGFEQAVEELVCNSLDAGATLVRVQFDGGGACVKVEDDGHGIPRDDLEIAGSRHATSKLRTLEELEAGVPTLGFRGEALSSLSDISVLEITSRVQGCPHTYCKIMQGGNTVSLVLSSQQRARGTTVIMRDIFYNQPVRRRLFNSSSRKLLQSVKERIVRLALAHSDVSFLLTDSLRMEEELHIRRHTTLYGTLRDVFGCEVCQGLKEVDFAKGRLRISGFLSSIHAYTSSKAIQYFYINHRFVHKTPLHKHMNRWGNSNCSKPRTMEKLDTSSSRKAYPAFILNLSCPLSEYDITFEATKTYVEFKDWTLVLKFLENVLLASWGDEERKRQAFQTSGKRRSWCRSDSVSESSLETKRDCKRARIEAIDDDISAGPLQDAFVSMPQLGLRSFRKGGTLGIGECPTRKRDDRYCFRGDLEIETSCTSAWGQLAKPEFVKDEVGWVDSEMSTPLFTDVQNRHLLLECSNPDILCIGSPNVQALSMPSSPVLSEGSWDSRFNARHGADDRAGDVSSASTDYGELEPGFRCLGSDASDLFQGMQIRPLRVKEPWISPDRDSDSMVSLLGGDTSDWTLPAATSSMSMLMLPASAWNELDMDGPNAEEDTATESCSDVEEAEFHGALLKWSDRLGKPSRQADNYAPELRQELLLSGESLFDRTTNSLAEVSEAQEGDRQEVISLDEIDNGTRGGHSNLQAWACTSLVEVSEHNLALSKVRSSDEGNGRLDEDLAPVASLYKVWSNPCMRANVDDILDVSAGVLESCNKSLQPDMVTKESLQHARVLQQVDTKFIAIVAQSVLLLVDQHAADERVQLEEFRAQVLAAGKKQSSTVLNVKHDLVLGFGEQQTLHAYRKQIEDWGWRFQLGSDAQSLDRNLVRNSTACNLQLTAVPCILGVNLTATDLEEYLQQLGVTQGASVPPPAVVRLLNYKSCRGAIMFGDPLLPAECRQLVSHLKRTSLCFQCAHGRPTMVPLVNVQNLRQKFEPQTTNAELGGTQTSTCEVQAVATGASWRKLVQRPLSLQRARERLHHQAVD